MTTKQKLRWLAAVALGGLLGAHLTAIGVSLGTIAAALLFGYLLLMERIGAWWRTPAAIAMGFCFGFCLILPIEIVLGIAALNYGPIYPPGRELTISEILVATPLDLFYRWRLHSVVETLIGVFALSFLAEFFFAKKKQHPATISEPSASPPDATGINRKDGARGAEPVETSAPSDNDKAMEHEGGESRTWSKRFFEGGEHLIRGLEFTAFALLALQVFHFSRVADFNANGIDALVARYGTETDELHRKLGAIGLIKEQIDHLSQLKTDLATKPPSSSAQQLLQAVQQLAASLKKLDESKEATRAIEMQSGEYDPKEVTRQAVRQYSEDLDAIVVPDLPAGGSLRQRTGNLPKVLKGKANATDGLDTLTVERANLLEAVSAALAAALELEQAERREALARAVARLVAKEGVSKAIEMITRHLDDLAHEVREQEGYNSARRRDFAQYEANYRVYLQEGRACAGVARALEDFFARDPDARVLVTKLNGINPEERAQRGLLLAREGPRGPPSLTTTGTNDDEIRSKIEREATESLPSPDNAADRTNVDYHQGYTDALRRLESNPESFATRFLQAKLDTACAIGSSGDEVTAELKRQAHTL